MRHTATSAAEEAYRRLKDLILTNEIQPGSDLSESGLSARVGLGRTPVREALHRLVHEGFVEARPRQGYRVRNFSVASVREIFEMRLLLEPAAAELAVDRASDDDLEELRPLAERTYPADDRSSYEEFLEDNRELHVRIAQIGGNERLAAGIRVLLEEMQRLFSSTPDSWSYAAETMHGHGELLEALIARDRDRARRLAVDQIEESKRQVLRTLLGSSGATAPPSMDSS